MRFRSKTLKLATVATLAVALAGCGSGHRGSTLDAVFLLVALPIYAAKCAGGGCDAGPGRNYTADAYKELEANFAEQCRKAEAGDAKARFAVGNLFRYGFHPVDRNEIEAYKWFSLIIGADKSEPHSDFTESVSFDRERLARGMTEAEISEAERRASAWKPNNCKPSGRRVKVAPQTGTTVGDTRSAPVFDRVERCAPSVRHLGDSYCATDPNRS